MKSWTWLLPCWIWKYFFAQLRREKVLLDGRTRFLIRLDEEFVLVYDPRARGSQLDPGESQHPTAHPRFRKFEKPSLVTNPGWSKQVPANQWLKGGDAVLARKMIKAAR